MERRCVNRTRDEWKNRWGPRWDESGRKRTRIWKNSCKYLVLFFLNIFILKGNYVFRKWILLLSKLVKLTTLFEIFCRQLWNRKNICHRMTNMCVNVVTEPICHCEEIILSEQGYVHFRFVFCIFIATFLRLLPILLFAIYIKLLCVKMPV